MHRGVALRRFPPMRAHEKAELSTNGVPGTMTEDFKLLVVELGFICKLSHFAGLSIPMRRIPRGRQD